MESKEELLEPLKLYKYELAYKHQDNIDAYFDELTKKSGVDIEANKQTCGEYYGYLAQIKALEKKLGSQRGLRGFLIFQTVFGFIVGTGLILAAIFLRLQSPLPAIFYSVGPFLIIVSIVCIILNKTIINKRIDALNGQITILKKKADEKLAIAKEQMQALNSIYDWGIPSKLMSKTIPLIQMDRYFNVERFSHLVENYNYKPKQFDNVTTLFIQSGTVLSNPFMYKREYSCHMYQKTYTGSIVITWVTYSKDSKGNSYPVTHTQTLTATITRPAPGYGSGTELVYANEAAPKLTFSRQKSNANSMSDREISKLDDVWSKKLNKMQEDKINTGFTPLANSKFEGLFHAFNRNNEVEFRLLFTPLAQNNMFKLLTSKVPYGDDFSFTKDKMINIIRSDHAQTLDFDGNPYHFRHFDYEKAKENFTAYNMKYFQGIFFDFAPLFSIPLYQQHDEYDYHFTGKYPANHTHQEAEVMANFMDEDVFKPEDCRTNIILKSEFVSKQNGADIFMMHAHGFRTEPRMEFVSKMGGDGHMHTIPVPWEEYIEVEKDTPIVLMDIGANKEEFYSNYDRFKSVISNCLGYDDIIYQRGLVAFPLTEGTTSFNGNELKKLFSHKED